MAANFLFESGEKTFVFLRLGLILGSNVNNESEWLSGFGVDDDLSGVSGEPNGGKVPILSGEGEPNEGKGRSGVAEGKSVLAPPGVILSGESGRPTPAAERFIGVALLPERLMGELLGV